MLRLDRKVVLAIGLGQTGTQGWGIGAACAVLFARQGATIFGDNLSIAAAAKTKQAIEEAGQRCDIVETDATSSSSVKALVDACSLFEKPGRHHGLWLSPLSISGCFAGAHS